MLPHCNDSLLTLFTCHENEEQNHKQQLQQGTAGLNKNWVDSVVEGVPWPLPTCYYSSSLPKIANTRDYITGKQHTRLHG